MRVFHGLSVFDVFSIVDERYSATNSSNTTTATTTTAATTTNSSNSNDGMFLWFFLFGNCIASVAELAQRKLRAAASREVDGFSSEILVFQRHGRI